MEQVGQIELLECFRIYQKILALNDIRNDELTLALAKQSK
jgi:hypothetical protein